MRRERAIAEAAERHLAAHADNFGLDFGTHDWTLSQRATLAAAMVSIDYDYFENNEGAGR